MKKRVMIEGVKCQVEYEEGKEEEFRRKLNTPYGIVDDRPSYSPPPPKKEQKRNSTSK
jgi:hypothetical protein